MRFVWRLEKIMQNKIVIFDWGGVILHTFPDSNSDRDAIVRTIQHFQSSFSSEEAWNLYRDTLRDENNIIISVQNDEESKEKWVQRICNAGNFHTSMDEFSNVFSAEYLKTDYYQDVVHYIYSLKDKCKIGLFSDLIYACYPALAKQLDLSSFDYVWLSYVTHSHKSSEDAFRLVEQALQLNPKDIMFIDDTSINIENAAKRGWNTCQAKGYELDKIQKSISDFLGL